jgi:hypothetical protein
MPKRHEIRRPLDAEGDSQEAAVHTRTRTLLEFAVHARQPLAPAVHEHHPSMPTSQERQPSAPAIQELQIPPAIHIMNSESPSHG